MKVKWNEKNTISYFSFHLPQYLFFLQLNFILQVKQFYSQVAIKYKVLLYQN